MTFLPDTLSTEDALALVLSSTLPPLPAQESHVGAATVCWWEVAPGEVYIHAEGGTGDDRHYGSTLVGLQLEPHGYRRAQFDMDDPRDQAPDLNRGQNLLGPLDGEARVRINAVLQHPSHETWDDARSIILNPSGITLWQAVLKVRPDLNWQGQVTRWVNAPGHPNGLGGYSEPVGSPTGDLPTPPEIAQALQYAFSTGQYPDYGHSDLTVPEDWDDEHLASRRIASWPDLMAKAKRLIMSGQVHVLRNGYNSVMGHVIGDHGEYDTEISRDDPSSRSITGWQCSCPWDQYAWQRTRKWKKFEGRPCSHVMALYWKALSTPLDEQLSEEQAMGMGTGQKIGPGAPAPMTDKMNMPRSVGPEGDVIQGDQQKMFGPEHPEAIGHPPGPAQAPMAPPPPAGPQPAGILPPFPGEQMQMEWAGPGTTPGGGVSPPGAYTVPGAKPQTPSNPVQNPSTYSSVQDPLLDHLNHQTGWQWSHDDVYRAEPAPGDRVQFGYTPPDPRNIGARGTTHGYLHSMSTAPFDRETRGGWTPSGKGYGTQIMNAMRSYGEPFVLHSEVNGFFGKFPWLQASPDQRFLKGGVNEYIYPGDQSPSTYSKVAAMTGDPKLDELLDRYRQEFWSGASSVPMILVDGQRLSKTSDFNAPEPVRAKKPLMGLAEGPVKGQYGDGEYREIPVGTPGEVYSVDDVGGQQWIECRFDLLDSGPNEPFRVVVYAEPGDIESAAGLRPSDPTIRRHTKMAASDDYDPTHDPDDEMHDDLYTSWSNTHDYDPRWDYGDELRPHWQDHPLVQQAQQRLDSHGCQGRVYAADLSDRNAVGMYIDGTGLDEPVMLVDPHAHEQHTETPEEAYDQMLRTVDHEYRHAQQSSEGSDYDEDDAEDWRPEPPTGAKVAGTMDDIMNDLDGIPGMRYVMPTPNEELSYQPGDRVTMEYSNAQPRSAFGLPGEGNVCPNTGTVVNVRPPGTYQVDQDVSYDMGHGPYGGRSVSYEDPSYDVRWDMGAAPDFSSYYEPGQVGEAIEQHRLWPEGHENVLKSVVSPHAQDAVPEHWPEQYRAHIRKSNA